MPQRKHPPEWYEEICLRYLNGEGSYKSLAKEYGIGHTRVEEWVTRYRQNGISTFTNVGNRTYSAEFKRKCVEEYLAGEASQNDICAKYDIPSRIVLRRWIKRYNANMELRDYDPKREVYMAGSGRKTTKEERIDIVEYCLEHERNYKDTAARFGVSYSQVYDWVKKYEDKGEDGLKDNRGKRKTDEELNEMERLRRENLRLKRLLEEEKRTVELLKKVRELERK